MKTLCSFLMMFVLACPNFASNYQQVHVVITPSPPHHGQIVNFSWNGTGSDVSIMVWCDANDSTVPQQASGTHLGVSGSGWVREDGVDQPPLMVTMASSDWTSGGADCYAYADIISYSGGSGNYQQKFSLVPFTVLP
jgi:hypothetical protein